MKLGIVGTGNMGKAILNGLLDNVLKTQDIICVDKSQESLDRIAKAYQVVCSAEISAIKDCDVVLLAVKPQNMDEVLPLMGKVISEKTLIISIAVGITSSFIVNNLGINKAGVFGIALITAALLIPRFFTMKLEVIPTAIEMIKVFSEITLPIKGKTSSIF